jgi:hypothetical protein
MIHTLTRLDARPVPDNRDEIRLVATVRNEITRLPHFVDYYRRLGVNRFFFTDNDSDDGTTAWLLAQPDCHVLHTADSYGASRCGVDWQNRVLDACGTGHWCVVADADELLAWPRCEETGLRGLCDWMDREGSEGLYTFMLDMYHDPAAGTAACEPGKPFADICPLFDTEYRFVKGFVPFWKKKRFPDTEAVGGPRLRTFYPEQAGTDFLSQVKYRVIWNMARILARMRLLDKKKIPHPASLLYKVPLVKWRQGRAYVSSTHLLNAAFPLSAVTGVLLHFKFFDDFYEKALRESARGEHVNGGIQYARYAEGLEAAKALSFVYKGTARYRDSGDLLRYGLARSAPGYEALVNENMRRRA